MSIKNSLTLYQQTELRLSEVLSRVCVRVCVCVRESEREREREIKRESQRERDRERDRARAKTPRAKSASFSSVTRWINSQSSARVKSYRACVCVCVCQRESEREREREKARDRTREKMPRAKSGSFFSVARSLNNRSSA